MGAGATLTGYQLGKIAAHKEDGLKQNVIAAKVGCTPAAVSKALKRMKETDREGPAPHPGRTPILSERDKRHLNLARKKNNRAPFAAIAAQLPIQASERTIQNAMYSMNIHRRKARKAPGLTLLHVQKRRGWLKEVQHLSADWWQHTWWSDECYVCLGDAKGDIYVSRTPEEVNDENCIVPTFQQSPVRVMVLGHDRLELQVASRRSRLR